VGSKRPKRLAVLGSTVSNSSRLVVVSGAKMDHTVHSHTDPFVVPRFGDQCGEVIFDLHSSTVRRTLRTGRGHGRPRPPDRVDGAAPPRSPPSHVRT
jgi:hypothetical protein